MSEHQTILKYEGPIEFDTTEVLLQKVKDELNTHDIKKVLKKRLYSIMVECIENMLRHSAKSEKTNIQPQIILEKDGPDYFVKAHNLVLNSHVEKLKEKLQKVTESNMDQLQEMYGEQINKEADIVKNGAGLGILTIALKSNSSINYQFSKVDEQYSTYELKVKIPIDTH